MSDSTTESPVTPDPEENRNKFAERLSALVRPSREFITGMWLLFLYGLCSIMVIYSLSAQQLNNEMSNYAASGAQGKQTLGVAQIKNKFGQWASLQKRVALQNANIAQFTEELTKTTIALNEVSSLVDQADTDYTNALSSIVYLAVRDDFAGQFDPVIIRQIFDLRSHDVLTEIQSAVRKSLLENTAFSTSIVSQLTALEVAEKQINQAWGHQRSAKAKSARIVEEIGITEEALKALECKLDEVQRVSGVSVDCDKADRARTTDPIDGQIGAFLSTMKFFIPENSADLDAPQANWFQWAIHWLGSRISGEFLIEMPPEMLTMIVVISMGALGGTIHLTQIFLDQRNEINPTNMKLGPWYFMFRPMLGCIVAISVFILARAGVLVVATPSLTGQGSGLSPYFVSFLGIISGLLAQNAVETIQTAGRRWFSNADSFGPERWAYGLGRAMKEAGISWQETDGLKMLSQILNVPASSIEHWINIETAVPFKHQTNIAAYVRLPAYSLFSDLKPTQMSVEDA